MDKSKYALSNALLTLIREKPYEKISIQEIAKRAYVSRTTFYNHFTDKDDVIRAILQDAFDPVLRLDIDLLRVDFRDYLITFLQAILRSADLFLLLRQSGIISKVPEMLEAWLLEKLHTVDTQTYLGDYADLELLCKYESRLTFFSSFWFLNHASSLPTEALADVILSTRRIGYREQNVNRPYQPLVNDPYYRFHRGDARAKATKQSLYDALGRLLNDKPLHDLTISDLTEAAGVSRCSFYRHYSTLEQLLEDELEHIYADVIRDLPSQGHLVGYAAILRSSLLGYLPYRSIFSSVADTDYEMTALRAYRSVYDVLLYQLPYIQGYLPTDSFTQDYYRWFLALEHIIPVMIYFSEGSEKDISQYADYIRFCRFYPFWFQDLRAERAQNELHFHENHKPLF